MLSAASVPSGPDVNPDLYRTFNKTFVNLNLCLFYMLMLRCFPQVFPSAPSLQAIAAAATDAVRVNMAHMSKVCSVIPAACLVCVRVLCSILCPACSVL